MHTTRRYRPEDRQAAIETVGDARVIDQARHHLQVADEGPRAGVAIWTEPDRGGEPYLGAVRIPTDDRQLFYRLVTACAQDALERGYTHATFTISDSRLLSLIQRDFVVDVTPSAWHPESGEPAQWDVRVALDNAVDQLRSVLTPEGARSAPGGARSDG